MKKIFMLISILCLCALFFACDTKKAEREEIHVTETTASSIASTVKSDETEKSKEDMDDYIIVDPAPLLFRTVEKYEQFVKENENALSADFVKYSDICELGEFAEFSFVSNGFKGDYSEYRYVIFVDEYKNYICVDIRHNTEKNPSSDDKVISSINHSDLRRFNSVTGVYEYDGVCYKYSYGKLWHISWENSDKTYIIWGDYLADYPLSSKDTDIMSKLLNIETSKSALQSIFANDKINTY